MAMIVSVAITGPGTRPDPAENTASPRTAYRTAQTNNRFAPANGHAPGSGSRQSASPTTQPQTSWSLN